MRRKGCSTSKECWNLKVINQNEIIFERNYKTLKEVANECGMTYNQVVEISTGRKKQKLGRFDTQYQLTKLSEKLNKEEPPIQEPPLDEDDE